MNFNVLVVLKNYWYDFRFDIANKVYPLKFKCIGPKKEYVQLLSKFLKVLFFPTIYLWGIIFFLSFFL